MMKAIRKIDASALEWDIYSFFLSKRSIIVPDRMDASSTY
jgi:hypothetical protein